VLTILRIKNLVGVVRGQCLHDEIGCPLYLIGATTEGSVRLCQEPEKPLPLRESIFLHSNNDIPAWLLANHEKDALDLLVAESRRQNREDRPQTLEPAKWRYPLLNANIWDHAVRILEADEYEDEDEDEDEEEDADQEEWLEAEREGELQAPPYGGGDCFGQGKYRHLTLT